METKNLGVLIGPQREKDYILGADSGIKIDRSVKDWSIYLPGFESQRNKVTDFMDCVTMSALNSIETQLNYLMSNKELSDEAMYFFHNNGYLVDGVFCLSSRFNAKLNGTEKENGNYLNVVGDYIRRDGIIPNSDSPVTDDMTWQEFYMDIPAGLIPKAKKALWFIDIRYQFIELDDMVESLGQAPLQVATELCPGWDSGKLVNKCSGQELKHATMVYARDGAGDWLDLDHYPPFKQVLAKDYEFPLNLQYIVTAKPLTLKNGMNGCNVLKLQKDMNKLGFILKEDGDFGPKTEQMVKSFQNKSGLKGDGIAGPKTLAKIKEFVTPHTLLDAIITVESGGNDDAEGDKGLKNHAYGCLQIRQGVCDDVNAMFNTNYNAQDCLGHREISLDIWNKYWKVYFKPDDEDKARTWNGGPGWKQIYFKVNKTQSELTYCKNLDIYWNKIKKLL